MQVFNCRLEFSHGDLDVHNVAGFARATQRIVESRINFIDNDACDAVVLYHNAVVVDNVRMWMTLQFFVDFDFIAQLHPTRSSDVTLD